jgi:hypothetical protein
MSNRKMKVVMVSQPRQKGRKSQGSAGSSVITDPPQYIVRKRMPLRIRYIATADNLGVAITVNTMKGLIGGIVIGASAFAPFCDAVRIKRIRIWTPCLNGAAPITCSVLWASLSNFGLPQEVADTSSNIARHAHVDCRPPKNSLVSDWLLLTTASTTILFTVRAPQGSIMDVDYDVQYRDDTGNPALIMTSGPALGGIGYADFGSTTFTPVELPTVHIP